MQNEFQKFIQETTEFVNDLAEELEVSPEEAYRNVKTVLRTIREVVTPEESLHICSQLPMILKGTYIDGWKLRQSANFKHIRDVNDFIAELNLVHYGIEKKGFEDQEDAKRNFEAVLVKLKRFLTDGQLKHIKNQLPDGVKELIPV